MAYGLIVGVKIMQIKPCSGYVSTTRYTVVTLLRLAAMIFKGGCDSSPDGSL